MIIEAMIHDTSDSLNKKSNKKKRKKSKKNKLKNPNANSNKKKIDDFKSINKGKVSKNKKNSIDEKIPAREKINAKQALNSKKKRRVKILCGAILFVAALVLLLSSRIFDIKEINVNGISKLTKEEVISISQIPINTNIFALNKLKAKYRLLENSYIEDVYIKREYPSTITINIKEKVPTFMIQFANSYIYLNNQGYMLEVYTEALPLPTLLGIKTDLSNVKPGKRLDVEDLKKFNKLIQIMDISRNFELDTLITRIDITDTSNYTVYIDSEGKTVYLGDAVDLNTKILHLKEILNQNKGKSGEIFLDMDLNEYDSRFRESY